MRALLIVLVLLIVSCKKDDPKPSFDGLWNTDCTTHTGTMQITGSSMDHEGACVNGTVQFSVSGNEITIPYQRTEYGQYHQATGTITANSMTLNYRVYASGAIYNFTLKGVK